MATKVDPPNGICPPGKHHYMLNGISLFEIDKKYTPIKAIGTGAYGVVCSAVNAETGEKIAIKKITNVFEQAIVAKRILREICLLRYLCHENLIALKDIMRPSLGKHGFKDLYLVYDLMDSNLDQIIRSKQALVEDHYQYFMYQLLSGVKYVHSANVLHRDLKTPNLLVNANCDLKICDLGLARTGSDKEQPMTEYVVTRWYRAPELLVCCEEYSNVIDMWSVGCIFAELLGRKPLFPGKDYIDQLELIINVIGSPKENELHFISNQRALTYIRSLPFIPQMSLLSMFPYANPLAINLLEKMLVFDPKKRITAREALEHPYFSMFQDDDNVEPSPPASFELDFEEEDLTEVALREGIWNEILLYHPKAPSKV